eukprot:227776_1
MSVQVTQIALKTSNALKQSLQTKSFKVKQTTNFPASLITEIQPSLQNRFTVTKTLTRSQSRQYDHDTVFVDTSQNALVIEADDENIIQQVEDTSRYIHHHSSSFHLSTSHSISPMPVPSAYNFRRPEYRTAIKDIARKYGSTVWCYDGRGLNQFGIFTPNPYDQMSCIHHIQHHLRSVMDSDFDYIQCDEMCKGRFFTKQNQPFLDLLTHCNRNYPSQYNIDTKHGEPGYIWIISKNKECRTYIKEFIEGELQRNWCYKYINIDNHKISILLGRPHNNYSSDDGRRYNEFWKMFRFDEHSKSCYMWNKYNQKCTFHHVTIPNTAESESRVHQICIVANAQDYDGSLNDAKEALEEMALQINERLDDNNVVKMEGVGVEYQCVLTGCFADKIHYSIRWDADSDRLYIKHDDNGEYEGFESMVFDTIIPNTLFVESVSMRELNVLKRVLVHRMGEDDQLQFIQVILNGKDGASLVMFDTRIGGEQEYREYVEEMINDIRNNEMDKMHVKAEFIPMIIGRNGSHLEDMLSYCGWDTNVNERSLVQLDRTQETIYFGFKRDDERLIKLKRVMQSVIDGHVEIELYPKEWRDWSQCKKWKAKVFQDEFPKSCIHLCRSTADKMLFYGSEDAKKNIEQNQRSCK